jgi:hypothetical protein
MGRQVGAAWGSCNKGNALSEVAEGTALFLARVQEVIRLTILSVFLCLAGAGYVSCVSSSRCCRHKRVIAIQLYCSLCTESLPQDIQDAITEKEKK